MIFRKRDMNAAFLKDLMHVIVGLTATIERPDAGQPFLSFGTDFSITIEALWRLSDSQSIVVTGDDHGPSFGLPAPVDAAAKANVRLADNKLESIEFDGVTGDLKLKFAGALTFEVISNSSGYESWTMWSGGEFFAAGANGGLV